MCDTDNCNNQCRAAADCPEITISKLKDPKVDVADFECTATCNAEGRNAVLLLIV